jgi:hypothetical protein
MNQDQIRRTTQRQRSPAVLGMPATAWRSILEVGRLAPTPHNTQWYFVRVVDSGTAHVCIDESIAIPFTDPNDQFRYVGLGVFARHLELAARAAGFELHTTFDDLGAPGPVTARIVGRQPRDEALAVLLRTRQTSRFAYGPDPVSAAAIEAVEALTDPHTTLTITTDPGIVQAVLELNNEILVADLQDKGTSRELDGWIRYTERSRRRHRNGFTPASLATPAWKIWLVFRLRSLLRFAVVRRWLTRQYLAQNRAATVGWISGPLSTHDDQFRAGRTLMDAWITVTEYGYYLQPYGSIITDDAARARLLRIIGVDEAPDELVWMIFRVGTSSPSPRSLRKPVEEYLR